MVAFGLNRRTFFGRITSYNVCYTKLLRAPSGRERTWPIIVLPIGDPLRGLNETMALGLAVNPGMFAGRFNQ